MEIIERTDQWILEERKIPHCERMILFGKNLIVIEKYFS